MKTVAEFKELYKETLLLELAQLDRMRKNILFLLLALLTYWVIFLVMLLFYLKNTSKYPSLLFLLVTAFVGGIVFYRRYKKKYSAYYGNYKNSIIGAIIRFIDNRLEYHPDYFIPEDEFKNSNIFDRTPDQYDGSDYVCGKIGETEIRFSQIEAQYKTESTYTDDDHRTHTEEHWHTIFKGIFFIADFNKDFSSQTLVLSASSNKFIRFLTKKRTFFGGWQTIKIEDPEFDRHFIVYGTDQIESRYVLSTSLMRRILDFRKKSGGDIYISFLDSKIYVAIPCKTLFKPSLFCKVADYETIYKYFLYLQLAVGIVDDFDLNTRIWSKQPALKCYN